MYVFAYMFCVRCLADKRCLVDTGGSFSGALRQSVLALRERMDSHPLHNIWKAPLEAAASTPFLRLSRTPPGPHTTHRLRRPHGALKHVTRSKVNQGALIPSNPTAAFIDGLSPFFPSFAPFSLSWCPRELVSRPRLLKCSLCDAELRPR